MLIIYILLFLGSCLVLFFCGSLIINTLLKLAHILAWREFVVAFFVMAFAASLPNLFIGINSALHKVPGLSLGDVTGGNVINLTLAISLAVLFAGRAITVESRMVQTSAMFAVVIAILPQLLIWDGILSRGDGFVLILTFFFYICWLFAKQDRFKKTYEGMGQDLPANFKGKLNEFLKSAGITLVCLAALVVSSEVIVRSSIYFAEKFNASLYLIGILIVGLGNAVPEMYFALAAVKHKEFYLVLGDLLGSVIVTATLVLGIVALICPIQILNPTSFLIARIFLLISALFFLITVKTGRRIDRVEALILLFVYFAFLAVQILVK